MTNSVWHELWIIFLVVLAIIGFFAGHSVVVGFASMALLASGLAWAWNKVSLEDLSYHRRLSDTRVFSGDEVTMSLTLTNRKPVPLGRVEVDDELPEEIEIADARVHAGANPRTKALFHSISMSWYERIRWRYILKCSQPGLYRLGPARLESGDLFGFFRNFRSVTSDDYLLVYPKVVPLPELGLPAARPLGDVKGGIRIFEDPSRPAGIREYQQGDPLKIVDWKATARAQSLQVRTFEPSSTITVILVVVVETMRHRWEGYSAINLERVRTAAASVATYAAEQRYNLGLFSNGTPILADRPMKLSASRSPEQLTIILEGLATIRPMESGPMARQLEEEARKFPLGATLVVIAGFIAPELVETIGYLTGQGYRMVVLYVGDQPSPSLPDGVLFHELSGYFDRIGVGSEFSPS